MTATDPSPAAAQTRAALRVAGRVTGNVTLVFLAFVFVVLWAGVGLSGDARAAETDVGVQDGAAVAAVFVGMGLVALLFWRRRWPLMLTVVAAAVAVVLPTGPVVALIAMTSLIGRRFDRPVWFAIACTSLATFVSVARDARHATYDTSAVAVLAAPTPTDGSEPYHLSWVAIALASLAVVAVFVVIGLWRQSRRSEQLSRQQVNTEQARRVELNDQVRRQAEREMLAREAHDTLGHRLSLIALNAGGLKMAAERSEPDSAIVRSASMVHEQSQLAVQELQRLLDLVREPGQLIVSPHEPADLSDLATVVDDLVDSGAPIISTVFISDGHRADPTLARAVYRIVQELTTNAQKHAGTETMRLLVRGGPKDGVEIHTVNWLPAHSMASAAGQQGQETAGPGSHDQSSEQTEAREYARAKTGLVGVQERVHRLGGTFHYGADGQGCFRTSAVLPWIASSDDAAPDSA